MKRYGFDDSPVMRELERLEVAKNGADKFPVKKQASDNETDVLSKMFRLSKELRKAGRFKDAQSLDEKIVRYATSERHIYNTHGETGDDLIDFAHQDGDIEVAPSEHDYGKVETQLSQHKRIVDIVQKEPTGKYATASAMNKVAKMLGYKIAINVDGDKLVQFNSALNRVKSIMRGQQGGGPRFDVTGGLSTRGLNFDAIGSGNWIHVINIGDAVEQIAEGTLQDVWAYKWDIKWPALQQLADSWSGGLLSASKLQSGMTQQEFLAGARAAADGSSDKFEAMLNESIAKLPNDLSNPSETDLRTAKKKITEAKNSYGWKLFYLGRDEKKWIESKFNELEQLINELIVPFDRENAAKKAEIVAKMLVGLPLVASEASRFKTQADEIRSGKVTNFKEKEVLYNGFISVLKKINAPKVSSSSHGLVKIALTDADLLSRLQELAGTPSKDVSSKTPATTSTPATSVNKTTKPSANRAQQIAAWKQQHLQSYWEEVVRMQKYLHMIGNQLEDIRAKGVHIPPGAHGQLVGTALSGHGGMADFDGQWGPNTAKAIQTAMTILSQLPNNGNDSNNIKSGTSYGGLMHYAGNDEIKQREVQNIATENIKIMHYILALNGLGGISPDNANKINNKESAVYDNVPKGVNIWMSPDFTTFGIGDGGESPNGSAPIKNGDLVNLKKLEEWLIVNGMARLDSYELRMTFQQWKWYLERLFARAQAVLAAASDDVKTIAQKYVSDVQSLYRRLLQTWRIWKKSNSGQTEATGTELEEALIGGAPGVGGPGSSDDQGASGAGEGVDISRPGQVNSVSKGIPLGERIQPSFLASQYPGTYLAKGLAKNMAPEISLETIKRINSQRPEEIYRLIGVPQPRNWSQVLSELGYSPNALAVTFHTGRPTAVVLNDGSRATNEQLGNPALRSVPPRRRIENEWRLWKASQILEALAVDISKINNEYGNKVMSSSPNHMSVNNEWNIEWQNALSQASRQILDRVADIRKGRASRASVGRSTIF